jgi:hypothetical protein
MGDSTWMGEGNVLELGCYRANSADNVEKAALAFHTRQSEYLQKVVEVHTTRPKPWS